MNDRSEAKHVGRGLGCDAARDPLLRAHVSFAGFDFCFALIYVFNPESHQTFGTLVSALPIKRQAFLVATFMQGPRSFPRLTSPPLQASSYVSLTT